MPEGHGTRVLVLGAVSLNGGDAALLLALCDRVRETYGENCEITVADQLPAASAARYSDLRFVPSIGLNGGEPSSRLARAAFERARVLRLRIWAAVATRAPSRARAAARVLVPRRDRQAAMAYTEADIAIMTGGTSLVEHYPLRNRWLGLELATWLHRPLVLFTQSLGPFARKVNQRHMSAVAGAASLVLLRDERSRGHLAAIGIDGDQLKVSPDAAFGLTPPQGAERVPDGCRRVAISVRHWPYARDVQGRDVSAEYRTAIVDFLTQTSRERDIHFTFISTCQGDEHYWTDDSREAEEIAGLLPADVREHVTVDRGFRTPAQLMAELTSFDLVVATRMHMAILALLSGRPVLPIAYEFKTTELFELLDAGEWVVDLAEIDAEALLTRFDRLSGNLGEEQTRLKHHVDELREGALDASRLLAAATPRLASKTTAP